MAIINIHREWALFNLLRQMIYLVYANRQLRQLIVKFNALTTFIYIILLSGSWQISMNNSVITCDDVAIQLNYLPVI